MFASVVVVKVEIYTTMGRVRGSDREGRVPLGGCVSATGALYRPSGDTVGGLVQCTESGMVWVVTSRE